MGPGPYNDGGGSATAGSRRRRERQNARNSGCAASFPRELLDEPAIADAVRQTGEVDDPTHEVAALDMRVELCRWTVIAP